MEAHNSDTAFVERLPLGRERTVEFARTLFRSYNRELAIHIDNTITFEARSTSHIIVRCQHFLQTLSISWGQMVLQIRTSK